VSSPSFRAANSAARAALSVALSKEGVVVGKNPVGESPASSLPTTDPILSISARAIASSRFNSSALFASASNSSCDLGAAGGGTALPNALGGTGPPLDEAVCRLVGSKKLIPRLSK